MRFNKKEQQDLINVICNCRPLAAGVTYSGDIYTLLSFQIKEAKTCGSVAVNLSGDFNTLLYCRSFKSISDVVGIKWNNLGQNNSIINTMY